MKAGIIVGRFQVPELHEGHKHLIDTCIQENERVVILIGCTKMGLVDKKNPLSFIVVYEMLREAYPKVSLYPLIDVDSNEEWSQKVDKWCGAFLSPTLYGSRDSFIKHYTGKYPYRAINEIPDVSGTKHRDEIKLVNSADFRRGLIYAVQNYLIC